MIKSINLFNQKRFLFTVAAWILLSTAVFADVAASDVKPLKEDYPHWNFNNKASYEKLVKINNFIEANKNKRDLAVFDWDGTLYNENIPVKEMENMKFAGQPAWYIWMATFQKKFSFPVFPMFETKDNKFLSNVITFDKYLEGRESVKVEGYSKFVSTALFTAGMTPLNIEEGVNKFMKAYKPEKYAFLPMLDVLQKMIDSGFNVWIITGSNQYFVAAEINFIEQNIDYVHGKKYNFKLTSSPFDAEKDHIAGNGLKLMKDNKFSVVYDNRYVSNDDGTLYIVDCEGKEVVVKNLEKKFAKKAIFVAGNSGGDFYDTQYVVNQPGTLAIAVEARGDLTKLVKEYPENIVALDTLDIAGIKAE